jgi:hypothetical protein
MRTAVAPLALSFFLSVAPPGALLSQQNPFKLTRGKPIQVDYVFAGNVTGTGQRTVSADRVLDHQTTTGKFFGKTSTNDTWMLITPDSVYNADLIKKTGTRGPNMLPLMARAYDDLDGTAKQRLQHNLQDMSQIIARAFGTGTVMTGEKGETKTYAGEKCDERTFGSFTICNMQGASGVPLHVSGSLLCVDFEQTATAVRKGEPAGSAFAPPAGVAFRDAPMGNVDSLARGYVQYLASQQLTDSLAAARTRMASTPATPASGPAPAPTAEERAQQRQACEALKNFDLGKEMRAATNRVLGDAVHDALKEKQNQVESGAREKVKGFIRRPHF